MRESRCPTDSSTSNERDEKKGTHLLSDICKYLEVVPSKRKSSSRENVELGLEIEINESLKRVLTTPDGGSDDLLDVTIIRPSESDVTHETTVALNKEEVRDFISLVEQHHQNKLKTLTKPKKPTKLKDELPDRIPPVKQKPNTKNVAQETSNQEKIGTPCVCQHCGIMGVLVQSNNVEVTSEIRREKYDKEDKRKRREPSPDQARSSKDKSPRPTHDSKTKSTDQIELLREINSRIKDLERRIAAQEENAVPRDYLKHVLHKLLSQYREQHQQKQPQNLKNTGTQYMVDSKDRYPSQHKKDGKEAKERKEGRGKSYQIHTLLHNTTAPMSGQRLDIADPSSTSTELHSGSSTKKQPFYLWGEEVVTPGCDLKTKILGLLEEKIGKPDSNSQAEALKNPTYHSKIPVALPEKLPKSNEHGIKVERDEKLLFLGKMEDIPPCNIDDYIQRSKIPELVKPIVEKNVQQVPSSGCNVVPEFLRPDTKLKQQPSKGINSNQAKAQYPFNGQRTTDDTIFKKNIEAQKERIKDKPNQIPKFFNAYGTQKTIPESKTSVECVLQKFRNQNVSKEKDKKADDRIRMNQYEKLVESIIKKNNVGGFRQTKPLKPNKFSVPVDVTYVNPKITHWSEESTASEDKYMKYMKPNQTRKENLPVETKESLIYKLEFLKNLAKHKSADQSKVLNKIWTQAKKTAKSKNDAVFIKIPFKSVNTVEPRNNVIEMQLTLEQLETVVKSVKVNESNNKVANYKSSSEIDFGQRRHEEIRKANMEVLNKRRNLSAKSARNKK